MAAALILLILEAVLQFSHHKISKLPPGLAAPQEGAKSQLRTHLNTNEFSKNAK